MADNWKQHAIADVIALGRLGEPFGTIARAVRGSSVECERCWELFSIPRDHAERTRNLDQPKATTIIERRPQRAVPAVPPPVRNVAFPPLCFADDPRAVAECRGPVYTPARIATGSGCGCSAPLAAFG